MNHSNHLLQNPYPIILSQQNTLHTLIDNLFLDYSKLLVIRIDLYLKQDISCFDDPNYIKQSFKRMRNNMRHHSVFKNYLAYAAKLEYKPQRGWHYHVLFFFDGQTCHHDIHLAQQIGEYWNTVINPEFGSFYSGNMSKGRYKICPLGIISHADRQSIRNLKAIADYLCKDERSQIVGYVDASGKQIRTFQCSLYRPQCNHLGRPRNNIVEGKPFQAACTSQPSVPREISAEELAIYNEWIEEYPAKPKPIKPIIR